MRRRRERKLGEQDDPRGSDCGAPRDFIYKQKMLETR